MTGLRAIMVSVDYSDLLVHTLPYNRRHFDEVMVVTSLDDIETVEIAEVCGATVFKTDSFYRDGATFNKWRALEEGLDAFGRHGWICLMDADVIWPRQVNLDHLDDKLFIISPLRQMMVDLPNPLVFPPEDDWKRYPIHRNVNEWAGYTQIFHADCPYLGKPPWHQIDWSHAGGADSFFQAKWPVVHKIRPEWKCLHLGPAGENWFGRASQYVDGTRSGKSEERRKRVAQIWKTRQQRKQAGLDQFAAEKIRLS